MSFEFSPHKLVYGGESLGYAEGQTVLAPYALPGERLEVEALRTAKGVVHARPLRVLEAAPERIAPPCPYFSRCGGCHYQHLGIEHQLKWKVEILRETLRRIGKIVWDQEIPVHQANPWNYRNQAQLKVAEMEPGRVEVGFFEAESHRLVPIDECKIISPRLNAVLRELRQPESLGRLGGCREIELLADDQDAQVRVTFLGNFAKSVAEDWAADLLEKVEGVATVVFAGEHHSGIYGEAGLTYQVGEFHYEISPGSFFQASRYLLPEFVNAAAETEPGELALDLYAGVGLLTLPLARRFKRVIGVESLPAAARDLEANAAMHGLERVQTARQTAFEFLRRFAQTGPDLVILDPPRAGVGKPTLKRLTELRPRRLHYAACSPPTWARDLAYLVEQGYRLERVEMFDFFPHTYHIECLARLIRRE
ncbi:MAG TPA: 23S rRNA (uracil(1939)-C(5))-methyltransferase RlmD [Terriglobia bacterium]|nr:23S rRNA (uracil(1939)-C(5))-methyltransferase RlmD [Terriglobia bacterium]